MHLKMSPNKIVACLTILWLCINVSKAYDNNGFNGYFPIEEMNTIKANMKLLYLDLDALQTRLHLQSDLVNSIRTEVINTDTGFCGCNAVEEFNEIDLRLNKIKQNFIKLLNNNDDTNFDKIDKILFNVKTSKSCAFANDDQIMQEIKTELLNKTTKINKLIERLENLESKLENHIKPENENIKAMDNIVQQIHANLNVQENKLLDLNQHLSEFLIQTSSEVNNKSRCVSGNCLIYGLIEADKKLNKKDHLLK